MCALHAGEWEASQQAEQRAAAYAAAPPAAAEPAVVEAAASLEDLLKSLPPMPAGWKPGDAIPGLPAMAAAATAAEAASPPAPAAAAATAAPAAAPAAVPAAAQEDEGPAKVVPPPARPMSAAFNFALNPDMVLEFGGAESEDEDSSDDE